MSLSKKEIDGLMRLISLTKNQEINCEQCLSSVSEFAELELTGKSPSDALKAVEHHLSICTECHEEYLLLRSAIRKLNG
jgi:uncharacterized protein with PIN domain